MYARKTWHSAARLRIASVELGPGFLKNDRPDLLVFRSAEGRLPIMLVHRYEIIDSDRVSEPVDEELDLVYTDVID